MSKAKIFEASADSVVDIFCKGDPCFKIPVYQRQYNWTEKNIKRLFEDIFAGIKSSHQEDTFTFLGTILLCNEKSEKDEDFSGSSWSLIDGQQRLTTLALAFCWFQEEIKRQQKILQSCEIEVLTSWLKNESDALLGHLNQCIVQRADYPNKYIIPRLVRQNEDQRGESQDTFNYGSIIGGYLYDFVEQENAPEFIFQYAGDQAPAYKEFENSQQYIQNALEKWLLPDNTEKTNSGESIVRSQHYRDLFKKLKNDQTHEILEVLINNSDENISYLIRLIVYARYCLEKVYITKVTVDDDRYVYDIFESLNSTGEPLTAIETFKPEVVKSEGNGYIKSESAKYFNEIEAYFEGIKKQDHDAASKKLIIAFALLSKGEKLESENKLSAQRKFLRENYKLLDKAQRITFVRTLKDLVSYQELYWVEDFSTRHNKFIGSTDQQLALVCLALFKDMNSSLTIPILSRFYIEHKDNDEEFIPFIKALAAFVVLRRSATKNTAGIDSDFRDLMKLGEKHAESSTPLHVGTKSEVNPCPSIEEFKQYLRSYLVKKKLGTYDTWHAEFIKQPTYDAAKQTVCRFLLFCAAHNSEVDVDTPYLLRKGLNNSNAQYLTLTKWLDEDFSTVDHITPQNGKLGADFEDNVLHSIGNLILLPPKPNQLLSNKEWKERKIFYEALSATNKDKVQKIITKAEGEGIKFTKNAKTFLSSSRNCLPMAATISQAAVWNEDIINKRAKNIGTLVWNELADWIGFAKEENNDED